MNILVKVMKALSDKNRIIILKMLQKRTDLCVCEIQACLNISQSTVSKHLKILENAGLVKYQKNGLWVNYSLTDGYESPYAATLLGNLKHWLENDNEIINLTQKLTNINRETICNQHTT